MMTSRNRWMLGTTVVTALTATALFAQGCAHNGDEDEELRVALSDANVLITVKSGLDFGEGGGSGAGDPVLERVQVAGLKTDPACVKEPGLVAAGADVQAYDPTTNTFSAALGPVVVGSMRRLAASAPAGTYTARRKADPGGKWGDGTFTARAVKGNAGRGSIWHCGAAADSPAFVTPGNNLSIPIQVLPNDNWIPNSASNVYRTQPTIEGDVPQHWLGQYNESTGLWSGNSWNYVSDWFCPMGTAPTGGCMGKVFNEPNGWVRNGNDNSAAPGTVGTAIARYGKRLPNGAIQIRVLRPDVVWVSGNNYKAAVNGGGVRWQVPVQTLPADAIAN